MAGRRGGSTGVPNWNVDVVDFNVVDALIDGHTLSITASCHAHEA